MFDAGGTYLSLPRWIPLNKWIAWALGIAMGRWLGGILGYQPFYRKWTTDWQLACWKMPSSIIQRRFIDTTRENWWLVVVTGYKYNGDRYCQVISNPSLVRIGSPIWSQKYALQMMVARGGYSPSVIPLWMLLANSCTVVRFANTTPLLLWYPSNDYWGK